MPFYGRVGGGRAGTRGAHYKKQTYFWKGKRGARGPPTKNAYFRRVGREGPGTRGVPFYKKTIFERVARGGLGGPLQKRPFW